MATNITIKHLIFILLTIVLVAGQGGEVCSTFCGTNNCTSWDSNGCNGVCYSGWAWDNISLICDFAAGSQRAVMGYTEDAGGSAYVTPNPLPPDPRAFACDFSNQGSGVGAGTQYYGGYTANENVDIVLDIGTYLPHYAFDLYLNVILQDQNGDGNVKWEGSPKMYAGLLTTSHNKSQSMQTGDKNTNAQSANSGKSITATNKACGQNDKRQNYIRNIFTNFPHNSTGTPITVQLTTNNNQNNAIWYFRQAIFVARLCNQYCLSCYGANINECTACDVALGYMLSGTTCATSCLSGYGPTTDPAICVLCDVKCTACFQVAGNCSSCQTGGGNEAYLFDNSTLGYLQCVNPCPTGYFKNNTLHTCDICHPNCTSCKTTYDTCYSCDTGFGWNSYSCYMPCLSGFYLQTIGSTQNCSSCRNKCSYCTAWDVCTVCTLSGNNKAFLLNVTCHQNCPSGYYNDDNGGPGPNICTLCHAACTSCTSYPDPCQSCSAGFYLYNQTCLSNCPTGYIAFDPTQECLLCATSCVNVDISFSFSDAMSSILYIDMQFTRDIDWNTLDITTFQTVEISNHQMSNYIVSYAITGNSSYRITVQPKGYVFLYNETVTVTTMTPPTPFHTALDTMPFISTIYLKTAQTNWFLMSSPSLSETQHSIINGLGSLNTAIIQATTAPIISQAKKAGIFALIFNGAQITSATVLVNTVPAQNMYEGTRFWATSVFYDVPEWQQTSSVKNNAMGSQLYDLTLNQRRLFNLNSLYWRFQRTGMTTFFIYDVYIPLLLIVTIWIMILIAKLLTKYRGTNFSSYKVGFFTVLHKLHEITIIYVTIAMILEWVYFDAASTERWISLGIAVFFTVYFVGYHLYIYYDMIKYPQAVIGNDRYEYFVTRYGSLLKNIRYEQYDMKQDWSVKHWFRPYNYHLLSYYKKFCMIVAIPVFYDSKHWQISVLLFLQVLQIARFLATKPYLSCWRNVYRFVLQALLFLFFLTILINQLLLEQIIKNDQNTLSTSVDSYYRFGWFGFVVVMLFNIGFFVLLIVDIVQGCRYSSRQLMDEARRTYYYDKITEYENEKDQVPLALMNKWVKQGNLNNRNQAELPEINVRIQYYKLIKHGGYYDVDILKSVELFMNTDFNFHQQNNTTPGKQIKKRIKLSKQVNKSLFNTVNQLYKKYHKKSVDSIIIKTFVHIDQKQFKAGDRVPLLNEDMFQKIQLEKHTGQKDSVRLQKKLEGFPINAYELEQI